MAQVSLDRLTKRFGDVTAVDNLSLSIPDRAFVAILGPSGCGKTTAMRCIAGLEQPSSGEILIDGQPITRIEPQKRDIAMVFQNYALYPHFTIYQNIAYPLRKRQLSKSEIDERVHKTARFLQIEHLLARRPRELSGGEQQRVALGRAIVREPRTFLMDEPLSNLDAKLRLYMRAELKGLQQELGVTTIFVTHDQAEAMTMADLIAVMAHGQLQQLDTPQQIYQRPANLFVAGFVGSPPMNILSGQIERGDGVWLAGEGYRLDISAWAARHALPAAQEMLALGVRPEHIALRAPAGGSALIGEVYVSEPLGSEAIINIRLGAAMLKARTTDPDLLPARGECFALELAPAHIHGFDPHSGARIAEQSNA